MCASVRVSSFVCAYEIYTQVLSKVPRPRPLALVSSPASAVVLALASVLAHALALVLAHAPAHALTHVPALTITHAPALALTHAPALAFSCKYIQLPNPTCWHYCTSRQCYIGGM